MGGSALLRCKLNHGPPFHWSHFLAVIGKGWRGAGETMRRREFLTLLGSAAAWPLAARAQQPAKLPTIGLLGTSSASQQSQWTAAFLQRMRELGWTEGRNLAIEYRWAEGRNERF